ncbi:glycosyltransferase family 4 protein [Sphaerisporangium aureirubrum]|uniref:Glycosyltransferase family 4 protein n=1 Tax=Sphaerisporangium aureirubrum TaxID=1544736 RepID=A0ABW1NTD9_9ACTN
MTITRKGTAMHVLFVRPYTHRAAGRAAATSSDSLGFNVTCADALAAGLGARGVEVTSVTGGGDTRTAWVGRALTAFERLLTTRTPDVVLAFHAFWPFTVELRRIMDDAGYGGPLVTYTHGSHWDPTDLFRFERYPRLAWADLGNLLCADRVLVVSEWMLGTVLAQVRAASTAAAGELAPRLRRVGLPLDLPRIDAARRPEEPGSPVVVFNHAPVAAKRPEVFFELAGELMRRTDASVLVTRRFPPSALAGLDPARVRLGDDLPIDDYYAALWGAHLQVSTAVHESLGVATLEAMATGNCCLLPRIGAYPEITVPEGLYDDPGELLSRLVEMVERPGPRRELAARQMARTRDRYSPERVAEAVHGVLLEVSR